MGSSSLTSKCSFTVEINIFDSQVAICSTAEEMMGVLIESQAIGGSARKLFDAIWGQLPAYSTK